MAFCLQLRLLMWKNLLYRRRQKTRFCIEMIWPLFMFIILAWIRKNGLKQKYDACYYTAKSMPSSGLMPYVHTFFCGFNNTCFPKEDDARPKLGPLFEDKGFEKLSEKVLEIINKTTAEQAKIKNLNNHILNVSEGLLNVLELIKRKDALNESFDILKDYEIFKNNLDIAVSGYKDVTKHIELFENEENHREKIIDNLVWINEIIKILKEFICNDTTSEDEFTDDMSEGEYDSFGDDLLQFAINRAKYKGMSDKCISIMQIMESHPRLKLIWKVVKPFFVGKIIYTPVTEVTKKIMARVDKFFNLIKLLQPLGQIFDKAPNISNITFQQNIRSEDIDQLYRRLKSKSIKFFQDEVRMPEYKRTIRNLFKLYQRAEKPGGYFQHMDSKNSGEIKPKDFLDCLEANKIEGYHDFNEAESVAYELGVRNRLWGLIHFTNVGDSKILPFVNYTLRLCAERVDDTYYIVDIVTRWYPRARSYQMKYMSNGFLYLQDLLEHSILQEMTGIENIPGTIFQLFPYPCYTDDSFITAISATFPFFMVLSWIYTCSMIVKSIVYEKERRLKETMRVMGLGNGIHWLGWFIDSLIPMLFTVTMLTTILTVGKVMESSSFSLIFVFLTCYTLACISFSFLISIFFSRANIAAASAGIIFFFLYLPFPFMVRWMDYLESYHKFLFSFSMNVALGLGASYIAMFEESGVGMTWSTIATSPRYRDQYNMLIVIISLLIDFVVFLLLTWYLESVMPGQYGIPKPWYFPFMIDYWTNIKKTPSKNLKEAASKSASELALDADNFEDEPEDLEPGVIVDKLTKVYGNGKVAVNKLTLNFYEGQITSLLGHNGAGKTTTISMLTGIYRPTSGDAYVNGYSIKREMDQVRKSLGMCPQFNVLFDKLTVEEHLIFYGELRGGNKEALMDEIQQMLVDLQLERKKGAFPDDLSGGMQRKLSIAVAYIGGAKTVILDEPTSGVDPYSRRSIWELLIKYKKDRTIILTTHYMDEADLLSDRVAIVAQGRVRCAGSVTFLKEKFGKGYEITIEMLQQPTQKTDQTPEKYTNNVTNAIKSIIPQAKLEDQKGSELKYTLPERSPAQIAMLCDHLDTVEDKLGIVSYGITDCSLEDIFLTVTGEGDQRQSTRIMIKNQPGHFFSNFAKSLKRQRGSVTSAMTHPSGEIPKESKTKKIWRQFKALTVKRIHHTKRNRKAVFSEWIAPSLIILFAMFVMKMFPAIQERQPLPLLFESYEEPRYIFHSSNHSNQLTKDAIKELASDRGFGPCCIQNSYKTREDICVTPEIVTANKVNKTDECSCSTGMQVCSDDIDDPLPAHIKTASKEISIDLNNTNINDWIINTYPKYQISRLGGFEFNTSTNIPNIDLEAKVLELYAISGIPAPKLLVSRKKREVKIKDWTPSNTIWFNNKAWHSSPILLNYVNNGILRSMSNKTDYGIAAVNHPMNFTPKEHEMEILRQSSRSILTTIAVLFAMSFVPASFVLFIIEERVSNSKHLQLSSGVIRIVYWAQIFIWDMVCFTISSLICVALFFAFDYQEFISTPHIPGIILLLLLYGWAIIPLMYVGSFLFQVPASAFVALACFNVFVGVVTTIVPYILDNFSDKDIARTNKTLKKLFLVFPQFCLGDGLTKLSQFYNKAAFLKYYDIEKEISVFNWDFLLINFVALILIGIFFFIMTLIIEFDRIDIFKFWSRLFRKDKNSKYETAIKDQDEDVAAERERVKNPEIDDLLIIRDIYKKYKRKPQPSVRGLSLGLKASECFGLLGINGAGKTTTFKMLTGDIKPSSGEAKIKGYNVITQLDKARSVMGYCPQFDALHPLLTVRETLKLYADIRGIPSHAVSQTIDEMIDELGLSKFAYRLAGDLSGGNKRKLSTAIALMGKPPVVFLDEPTTGMDPKSRRFLWSCIDQMTKSGTCVVLTTHSMEECQALCTKLTIMVNGQFRCLGSAQHLKQKYGKGYQIIIRFPIEKKEDAKKYIDKIFPTSALDEEHLNQIRYHVTNIKVSKLFTELGSAKGSGLISDYSISQTTLEEVFMAFAKQEEQEDVIEQKPFLLTKLWNYLTCKNRKIKDKPTKKDKSLVEIKTDKSEQQLKPDDIESKKAEEIKGKVSKEAQPVGNVSKEAQPVGNVSKDAQPVGNVSKEAQPVEEVTQETKPDKN